ncbi:MAG: energy-dependent translational throttle protein EttA [Planctomycetes bacterium]|nr:energy-dependent translational throttle protein EttA [Planctomycetota bacterium]
MSEKFVFTVRNLTKHYGQTLILDNINLSFYHGAKIGIVGGNGAGKSTLLRIMAGQDKDFEGTAQPIKNMRVGYVPQEPRLEAGLSVKENLRLAFKDMTKKLDRFEAIGTEMENPDLDGDKMQDLMDEMARLQDEIDAAEGWELDRQLELAADALFLPGDDVDVGTLSGGEARRVYLCRTLLEKPDLLLLDEPTNHLDAETVSWLEQHLRDYQGTVIIVTHDRYFLDNITKWILEIDRCKGIPYEGCYSSWLEQKAARLEMEGKKQESHRRVLTRELEWIRSSPAGRRSKQKARVDNYEKLSAEEFAPNEESAVIQIPPGRPLGQRVIVAENLNKAYGDNVLFKDFNLDIPPGALVGVVGPNGAGKTTLFRMILGEEHPDSGVLYIGPSVEPSHVSQTRDELNDEKTIYEEITDGKDHIDLGGREVSSRVYVGRFNFRGSEQQRRVGTLSGGERNRVHLAKLLRRGGNLLLLDEPTNDLDTDTMRVLEQGLASFTNCALIISHDRFFLDRICTHLLVFEGDGKVSFQEGGFAEYMERKGKSGLDMENRRARYRRFRL